MGLTQLYCAEQIVVPDKFPNLLKGFAKAAVRTQPYDLLRWSAAYFRCLAMNEPPPAKLRFETEKKYGSVTKEYLRMLLAQLGKGYFVKKDTLFEKWDASCLPEHELLNYLSLCRMLKWSELHWLKLFAVMVGSLNDSFKDTVIMLCELLTDEPEGGLAYIPVWMFKVCYKFIAKLNCADVQEFFDGRKVLDNGIIEDESSMPEPPTIYSVKSFQDIIIEQIKDRMVNSNDINTKLDQNDLTLENTKKSVAITELSDTDTASIISSSFKFVGNFSDPYDIIRRTPDFDSIIVMMKQIKEPNLELFTPDFQVTEQHLAHAKERELKIEEKREQLSKRTEKNAKLFIDNEKRKLVKEIGPPWAWLHQFATQNSNEKSYNFLEHISWCSNSTPIESSDMSFDFVNEKFIGTNNRQCESSLETLSVTSTTPITVSSVPSSHSLVSKIVGNTLLDLMREIGVAENEGECSVTKVSSIKQFLERKSFSKEEMIDNKMMVIDYSKLRDFLTKAEDENRTFNDLNELYNYFLRESANETLTVYEKVSEKEMMEELANQSESELPPIQASNVAKTKDAGIKSETEIIEIFDKSGITVEQNLLSVKISDNMILGLAPQPSPKIDETSVGSSIETKESDSNVSICSSDVEFIQPAKDKLFSRDTQTTFQRNRIPEKYDISEHEQSREKSDAEQFSCTIQPIPGIGKSITDKTIDKFLAYLISRAFDQNGLICPQNFIESDCPSMMDAE